MFENHNAQQKRTVANKLIFMYQAHKLKPVLDASPPTTTKVMFVLSFKAITRQACMRILFLGVLASKDS